MAFLSEFKHHCSTKTVLFKLGIFQQHRPQQSHGHHENYVSTGHSYIVFYSVGTCQRDICSSALLYGSQYNRCRLDGTKQTVGVLESQEVIASLD